MSVAKNSVLCIVLCCLSVLSLSASNMLGSERYYDPLDKLASSNMLLSRSKEAPTSAAVQFPFGVNEYQSRMSRISGSSWDATTSLQLNKLSGVYAERMYDAMGVYAELYVKISEVFKKQQVSENYQLLAPMLSGMNLHYVSAGGKRGIWQLDIITATRYGLIVSDSRDDRDDPLLSAKAAAAYIKDLQSQFRSPEVVLWAYVSSPAEVRRAFARASSPDPKLAIDFLPEYVKLAQPIFSAWNFIWTYTEKDELPVFMPAIFLPYENAVTSGKTHLGQIAEVLEISVASLKELNPALKKQIADNKETIHLPQGYAQRFLSLASSISKYKDTVYFRPDLIVKPSTPTNPGVLSSSTYKPESGINTTVKKYHKVKPGETLSVIAQKYHVSVSSLKKWNHLSSSGIIAGQKIVVNITVQNPVSDKEDKSIRENVKIEDAIIKPDEEEGPSSVNTTVINKPAPQVVQSTPPKPKTSGWIYYIVRSGDTLSSIGRKYGVPYTKIKEWNGLRSDSLQVGQKLKIKK